MFLLKKLVAPLLFPLPMSLLLLLAGLLLLWFSGRQKTGKVLVSMAFLILGFCSWETTSHLLIRPLEQRFEAMNADIREISPQKHPAYIMVLGGGHVTDDNVPVASQLGASSVCRLVEGIALHRSIPGSKLILSEGKVFDPVAGAETMARMAENLGVDRRDMILEDQSLETFNQAEAIRAIVGGHPLILVTSATHMPRSMLVFKKNGIAPIPAPVMHLARKRQAWSAETLFPSASNLATSESGIYEYIGLLWSSLVGR